MRRLPLLALCALALASSAHAEPPPADIELLRPASGSDGTLGVEGTEGLSPDVDPVELRLLSSLALSPLRSSSLGLGAGAVVDRRWLAFVLFEGRLFERLSIAAQLPLLLDQSGAASAFPSGGPLSTSGTGDVSVTPRFRVLASERLSLLLQATLLTATGGPGTLLGDGSLGAEGLVAVSHRFRGRWGLWQLLGNARIRHRPPRDLGAVQVGNELGLRAALTLHPSLDRWMVPVQASLEADAAAWLRHIDGKALPLELRAGASYCLGSRVALTAGLGARLDDGLGAPSFRALAGVGYQPSLCAAQRPSGLGAESSDQSGGALAAAAPEQREPAQPESPAVEPAPPRVTPPALPPAAASSPETPPLPTSAAPAPEAPGAAHPAPRAPVASAAPPTEVRATPAPPGPAQPVAPTTHPSPPAVPAPAAPSPRPSETAPLRAVPPCSPAWGPLAVAPIAFPLNGSSPQDNLEPVVRALRTRPPRRLQVSGYADATGPDAFNRRLSSERALAVARRLRRALGIEDIRARGCGSSFPRASNITRAGRSANRRVEIRIPDRD